jgi:hypothetical protein
MQQLNGQNSSIETGAISRLPAASARALKLILFRRRP